MASQLEIVNQVLTEFSALPVTNVNDSDAAFLISQRLPILIIDLLKHAAWNFAIKYRTDNTPLTQNISPDFLYNYQLPPDYCRFDRFSWSNSPQFGFYYRIIDNVIMTNTKPINYYYVTNTIDLANITAPFEMALVYYLAYTLCIPITQDKTLREELRKEYKEWLDKAIQQNNMERYISSTPYNDFDRQVYI